MIRGKLPGTLRLPRALVDVTMDGPVSLYGDALSKRAIQIHTRLLYNAGDQLERPGHHTFTIPLAELRGSHESNDRLAECLTTLQRALVRTHGDGCSEQVQLLGWINLRDSNREHGLLRYDFPPRFVELVRNSVVYAEIELAVIDAVGSKYGAALYAQIARRVRLDDIHSQFFDIPRLRTLLRVERGKLPDWKSLKARALLPALADVNSLTDFNVRCKEETEGRKVVGVLLSWANKGRKRLARRGDDAERQNALERAA